MLILTRKTGQGFTIGDDIEIIITEVSGDKVRVGIEAPKHIKVLRCELSQTVEENLSATDKADTSALRALANGLKQDAGLGKNPRTIQAHKVKSDENNK